MNVLTKLGGGQGYLKAGLFGWQGSGKTYTAMLIAVGLRRFFKLGGPIVMFDSEGGSEYVAPLIRKLTGVDLVGVRAQSLADCRAAGDEAVRMGAACYLVDSITHPWREVVEAHLARINDSRRRDGLGARTRLEIGDWAQIKPVWNSLWTNFFLNAPVHTIICGRAGTIWGQTIDEETGRRELVQEGVKMKVEGEFAYEPSLLVFMEQKQLEEAKGRRRRVIHHQATVLKDRFGTINGQQGVFKAQELEAQIKETFGFFEPHLALLTPGAHAPVDTALKTDTGADGEGDTEWARERKARVILAEEIQGELVAKWPGQSADEKKRKTDTIHQVFGTRSWTQVENLPSAELREGLTKIRQMLWEAASEGDTTKPSKETASQRSALLDQLTIFREQAGNKLKAGAYEAMWRRIVGTNVNEDQAEIAALERLIEAVKVLS